MQTPHDRIPPTEAAQPDPQLQLSHGRAGIGQVAMAAFVCVAVIGVTIYGLGRPSPTDGFQNASASAVEETTGAATPAEPEAPQAGGETAAPAAELPEQQPTVEEPVPQLQKPDAVEDDANR
ncbi:hypothetical protein [Pseudorhodoplanes sp.]|uniref:hypothetical protein n=1 Tax=Pseudorhodoplanes sp. TaxID=1934341 RepID=UPI00391968AC